MADSNGVSLFDHLHAQLADKSLVFPTSKQTLIDLSHSIEDTVLNQQLSSLVFTCFQHERFWQPEEERYRQLARNAQQLCIFIPEVAPEPEEHQLFITLDRNDPLCQEWFVVVLTEQFAMILCNHELPTRTMEGQRVFETICSFEPTLVESGVDFLVELIGQHRPDQVAAVVEARRNFAAVQPPNDITCKLVATLMNYSQQRQDQLQEALTEQRRLQATQTQLEQTLVELAVPVVPLVPGVIVMPLVGSVDARRSQQVMEALLEGIASKQADVAILDITGVPLIDTNVANTLLQSVRAANLLGAQVILTGIGADIAQMLVHLEVDFTRMQTEANLQNGIEAALALQGLHIAPLAPNAPTRAVLKVQ